MVETSTYWVVMKPVGKRKFYYGYRGPDVLEDFSDARHLTSEDAAVALARSWSGSPLRVDVTITEVGA